MLYCIFYCCVPRRSNAYTISCAKQCSEMPKHSACYRLPAVVCKTRAKRAKRAKEGSGNGVGPAGKANGCRPTTEERRRQSEDTATRRIEIGKAQIAKVTTYPSLTSTIAFKNNTNNNNNLRCLKHRVTSRIYFSSHFRVRPTTASMALILNCFFI